MPKIPTSISDTQVSGLNRVNIPNNTNPLSAAATGLEGFAQAQDNINKRDAAAYTVDASSQMQIDELRAFEEAKTSYGLNELPEKYLNDYSTRTQKYIDNAPNDYARQAMQEKVGSYKSQMFNKTLGYVAGEKQIQRYQSFYTAKDTYIQEVTQNPEMASEIADRFVDDTSPLATTDALGKAGPKMISDGKKAILKVGADSLMYRNPDVFIQNANSGAYANLYTEDELNTKVKKALTAKDTLEAAAARERFQQRGKEITNISMAVEKGDPNALFNIESLTGYENDEALKSYFTDRVVTGNADDLTMKKDNINSVFELEADIREARKQVSADPESFKPENVVALQSKLDGLMKDSKITPAEVARHQKGINALSNKAAGGIWSSLNDGEFTYKKSDYDVGYELLYKYAIGDKDKGSPEDRKLFLKMLRDFHTAAEGQNANEALNTDVVMKEVAQDIINAYVDNAHPEYSGVPYDQKPNRLFTKGKESVVNNGIYKGKVDGNVVGKTVVKTQVSPSTGLRKIIYSDGTSEIK